MKKKKRTDYVLTLNLRGNRRKHNLGTWHLRLSDKMFRLNGQDCVAITDFENNDILLYTRQNLDEIRLSLRHELFHIIENYRDEHILDEEEIVCLQESATAYADDIIRFLL
jgi:Zn-dependent peptidase ImmA (M78 family)